MNAAHLPHPPRRAALAFAILAALALAAVLAASAHAASPWWHLSSGSRPSYLDPHAGQAAVDEVQSLTIKGEPGETVALANMTKQEVEKEEFEGENGLKLTFFEVGATPAAIQADLEEPEVYGAGNVEVTGGPGAQAGTEPYLVTFKGSLAHESVRLINTEESQRFFGFKGTAEVAEVIKGHEQTFDGELYLTAENLGNAPVDGSKATVTLKDVLPAGLKATAIAASKPDPQGDFRQRVAIPCSLQTLTCTMKEGLAPYDQLEMRISVEVEGAVTGELNEASVSGGGGAPASIKRPITVSSAPVPYGIQRNEIALEEEGGAPTTQAGAHPFQLTSTIALNQLADIEPLSSPFAKPEVTPPALAKDVNVKLPPGLIGNATAIPQCTTAQFSEVNIGEDAEDNACPADTAVGVATVTVHEPASVGTSTITDPIFNLEPRVGEPARFGFDVVIANSPVFIDTSVRTGGDYGVTVNVNNITQTAAFLSSETTFWGVPGDSRHDSQRGWGCIDQARNITPRQACAAAEEAHPKPFLSLPTSCRSSLSTSIETDSWATAGSFQSFPGFFEPASALEGCNHLQFAPQVKVTPDAQQGAKPSGVSVDVHVPQELNENSQGLASANLRNITVAFPEGLTLNPSAADGLQACSESQVGLLAGLGAQEELLFTPTLPEAFCPEAAKLGTVKIKTPLLPPAQSLQGGLYLATPAPGGEAGQNPFNSLLAMYIIARDPVSGVLVKLPGQASLDPNSGQITASFKNTPDLAFEDAEIHLFDGERAPLGTPSRCGTYTTTATLTPWSGTPPQISSSSFQITSGPGGGPCPSSTPFAPSLAAGTTSPNAGSFSALTTTIGRGDGEQSIQSVALHMPAGLSGVLKGVELCKEANADAGTCPPNSLIGHATASVGLGADPFTVTGGQVFLTESYRGAPFGLSILTPAIAGPFNLGNVIVRARIEVDPHTTALTVLTDQSGPYSIPHILDGIPLQIRHLNVTVDRPGFTFNPTSCNPLSVSGTIASTEGASAPVSSAFQATGCQNLKFAPKFSVSTQAKTSKANGASLKVKLSYPKAPAGSYANLAKVKVSLPKALPSRLTTLQKACTSETFDANPANCPKESIVGQAKVSTPLLPVPLQGNAYFVSHAAEAFPDLTIVLKGYGITVDLIGSTNIKAGITTTTFKATPDVPFEDFELNLPAQKYSALTANTNLCQARSKLLMPSEFTAQNGALYTQQTKISVAGCPKPLTRAQKLRKALKACHRRHGAKRRSCEAQARGRFGGKRGKKK
jgi:hypothetical protein